MITLRPEMLDLLYVREVALWVERLEAEGWYLATKPSPPKRRLSLDPNYPEWDEVIVTAYWKHLGPVAVLRDQDYHAKKEEEQRIGAGQLKGDGGIGKLRKQMELNGGTKQGIDILGGDVGYARGSD
jgi:hypothetical protein